MSVSPCNHIASRNASSAEGVAANCYQGPRLLYCTLAQVSNNSVLRLLIGMQLAGVRKFTFFAKPQNPDTFKRNLDQHRAQISTRLDILHIPWENRFYGVDSKKRVKVTLNFLGEIETTGEDQSICTNKIEEIVSGLREVFGESIPYSEPELTKITIDDSIRANIESVVPKNILRVVKETLKEYSVRDVSFGFSVEKEKKDVRIFFERPSSPTDTKSVPLRIRVMASSEPIAAEIQKQLKAEISA
jgi:hypothetical protein